MLACSLYGICLSRWQPGIERKRGSWVEVSGIYLLLKVRCDSLYYIGVAFLTGIHIDASGEYLVSSLWRKVDEALHEGGEGVCHVVVSSSHQSPG